MKAQDPIETIKINDVEYVRAAEVWLVLAGEDGPVLQAFPIAPDEPRNRAGMPRCVADCCDRYPGERVPVPCPGLTWAQAQALVREQDAHGAAAKRDPHARTDRSGRARSPALWLTRQQLAEVVRQRPGIELSEAVRQIDHHYPTDDVARSNLGQTITRHSGIEGVHARWSDDGAVCRLWPEGS